MALNVNVLNLQDYLLLKLKLEKVISLEDDEALKNMDVDNETPYVSRSEKDINALMNTMVCNEGEFKSSQRSESTNNVLNGIANKSISLTKFVLSFEDVVARWRSEETSEDYNCKKGLPSLTIRNSGILNHAAKTVTKIPNNYILRRYTKDAKKRMIEYVQVESHANDEETATIFRNNLMKLSYDIIMRSQGNEATRQFCRDALWKLDIDINRELTRLQLSENNATTENQIIDSFNEDDEGDPILDPPRVKRKGVSNARLKGHFEKRKIKARKNKKIQEKSCNQMLKSLHKLVVRDLHSMPVLFLQIWA
ncbi:hypothetical protein GH714_009272 [Hevea brasiliensis]|uniref:Protein FAR1-RELATED SEQUENCE n=1 Tax=Hevea brasiliensis TaxID=3981 RepID=A0A6A6KAR9_HEVBR|nr:hypothetical protein GH714_009272 [Hevea brasiliensis]